MGRWNDSEEQTTDNRQQTKEEILEPEMKEH